MWKKILLSLFFLLLTATPAFAITQDDIDLINAELVKIAIKPVENETENEPNQPSQYNLWKGQFDPWTKEDTYWQIALTLSEIIDWNQSINSLGHPESNPFLHKYPSEEEFNRWFTFAIISDMTIAYILPSKYRRIWQISNVGIELYCVNNNYQLGIKTSF